MPMSEYLGWMEFYDVEPWGLAVQDALHANGAALLANINRDEKKRKKPFGMRDFRVFPDKELEPDPIPALPLGPRQRAEMAIAKYAGLQIIRADNTRIGSP